MRRFMVVGNWKMNTTREAARGLAAAIAAAVPREEPPCEVVVCPPFPYLLPVGEAIAGSGVGLGAQDAYFENPGAFTGEVAVEMLVDVGCRHVILGHSERRHVLGETDEVVNRKIRAALAAGSNELRVTSDESQAAPHSSLVPRHPSLLNVIFCVGETLDERQAGRTEEILDRQLDGGLRDVDAAGMERVVIAYEPVWAIGTGQVATPKQAESAHAHLRKRLSSRYNAGLAERVRILYGGSVKPDNAGELLGQPDVDGALVGGASLKAETFLPIVAAAIAAAV
ncbi:MAG: triose-phosphate isomerase [Planctomycetales bacterium]